MGHLTVGRPARAIGPSAPGGPGHDAVSDRYAVTSVSVPSRVRGSNASLGVMVANKLGVTVANNGSAPVYDPCTVTFQLRSSTGAVVVPSPSMIDLRTYLPGSTSGAAPLAVPSSIAKGTYTLTVLVTDPTGYLAPMRLANASAMSDGAYVVGSVSVS